MTIRAYSNFQLTFLLQSSLAIWDTFVHTQNSSAGTLLIVFTWVCFVVNAIRSD